MFRLLRLATPWLMVCAGAGMVGCAGLSERRGGDGKVANQGTGEAGFGEPALHLGGGLDLRPEGPAVGRVQAAMVSAVSADNSLQIIFPSAQDQPSTMVSFPETDLTDRLGLAVDIHNTGQAPATVYADLDGDTWVRGYVSVAPGQTGTLYVFARRRKLSADEATQFPGMHGIPGGKMSLWAGIEEPIRVKELRVFVVRPRTPVEITVAHLRPFGSSKIPETAGFFPFVDRYGQYRHGEWPGKIHADADLAANIRREDADLAAHPGPPDFDQYGGWLNGPQLAATGHFRVEKYEGQWWFVDPDGRLFWSNGLDVIGLMPSSTPMQGRERFYADPAPAGNFLIRNLRTKYGEDWRDLTYDRLLRRLHSWGLNTIGGSAERPVMERRKVPYTLQVRTGGRDSPINPDSPAWAEGMRRSLAAAADWMKDDPWCIGFFVDNEIHASADPAWFERYYRQVSAVAKELMPHQLYLGSRLDYHDWPAVVAERQDIVRLAAKYCDVVSFNFYKYTLEDVDLPAGVDRPVIVGEFHFGALDRGLFHTGLRSVVDQVHRGEAYRTYVKSALRNPGIVGAHWFQCYDESLTGRFDGENYQIGFLDIADTPYPETIDAVRDVGYQLYSLRRAAK